MKMEPRDYMPENNTNTTGTFGLLQFSGNNAEGFILVLTMAILVVLSLIGLSATNLSQIELLISGNDRIHKETFYRADAGTEIGARLVYDNAVCVQVNGGFDPSSGTQRTFNSFVVSDLDFSTPQTLASTVVSDTNRAIAHYPGGTVNDALPHTNLLVNGEMKYSKGSGLQMVSGYEGLGASAIGGGTYFEYDIYSQYYGESNSQSLVTVGWRLSSHIINNAAGEDCKNVYKN